MIGAKTLGTSVGSPRLCLFAAAILLGTVFATSTFAAPQADGDASSEEVAAATEEVAAAEESEAPKSAGELAADALREDANILWTCLAAFLVFFMQAGFALVESGFTRAKNACNIIMKNLMDFSIGTIIFWLLGFGLMFGANTSGYVGTSMFFFDGGAEAGNFSSEGFAWSFLIFQTVFAATAATIVSGAVAGRTKFVGYLAYSVVITLIVYPIFGSWCWNGLVGVDGTSGWLESMGFLDYAGSTVVHSVGGWAALAGAIVIGPRKGKFKDGKVSPIPGHSIPLAALGVFILWLGWFGFNAGSTTSVGRDMAYIAVTTNLAAAGGAFASMVVSWILFKKPDVSFALNGALAGLVSITAGCDCMSPLMAALTGTIGGVLVVFSVLFIDKLKIDDPVGAVSVHGVCGAWGTLAIGIFSSAAGGSQLGIQALGVGAAFLWSFPISFIVFTVIKMTIGLRASEEHEAIGLDMSEHGMVAYPGLQAEGAAAF